MKLSQFADTACGRGTGKGSNVSRRLAFGAAQSDSSPFVRGVTAPIGPAHTVALMHAESSTVPASVFATLKPRNTDMSAHPGGATLAITGTDWMNVATLEFPLFSGRLSILIC